MQLLKAFVLLEFAGLLSGAAWTAPALRLDDAEVGFRMHLGVMKSPGLDVYNRAGEYGTAVQPALPVVFHNVWKSPDGRVAAILVNWSREPQAYSLTTSCGSRNGTVPPLACVSVTFDGTSLVR